VLGVDLGTTWTAASVGGEPLPLGEHGPSMPSVVAVADGEVLVGWRAVRAAAADPASAAREFKRRLGDTTPIVVAGTPYGAETLTGHLLGGVVEAARSKGHEPGSVVLTHPAAWGEYKLDLLREAGRVAGLDAVGLVPEPVAAAQHHVRQGRLHDGDVVAVYDFGGGTFDAAVVRVAGAGATLLGQPEGLERLGGIDLDQAVVAHVNAVLDGALSELDTSDADVRRAVQALRADCTAAKEALSADTETSIAVTVPGLQTQVRITRAELETAIRPRLAETLGALDRVIASTELAAGELAGIVLVGGSSRIPLVAELVASHTGRPLLTDSDPKMAVVLGAAASPLHTVPEQEHAMSTNTPTPPPPAGGGTGKDQPAGGKPDDKAKTPGGRRTEPGARAPEQAGMSGARKAAAGVAAAGAATAAGLLWHEQITDAIFGGDDAAAAPPDDAAPAAPADESMDAFDAGGGGGRGGGGGFARPAPQFADAGGVGPRTAAAPRMADAGGAARNPEFEATRAGLVAKLADWEPPEGADPAEVAALRERLSGLIERFEPRPGQSTREAVAELREEFDLRIDSYVQGERIEALIEAEEAEQAGTTTSPEGTTDDETTDETSGGWSEEDTDSETTTEGTPTGEETTTDGSSTTEGTESGADSAEPSDAPETPAPPRPAGTVRDHRDGGDTGADAPGGTTVGSGPVVRDHRDEGARPAAAVPDAVRAQLVDTFAEQVGFTETPAGPPAGGEPRPAPDPEPAATPEPAPAAAAEPTPAPPADDALGAAQVQAEVAAAEAAAPAAAAPTPAADAPAAEVEPTPELEPELEPALAGAAADPLANDPLGISREDLEPANDFADDADTDSEPDLSEGPADQADHT
jgi:actin-like ATPase involved in cell morphogenesis